jgi:HTH-like domain
MAAEGLAVQLACRVLAVSESGYYARRTRARSPRSIRHAWLTEVIRQVHSASRGTYGIRRVHADLTLGHGVAVGHQAVELLMRRAGIQGISGRPRYRRIPVWPPPAIASSGSFIVTVPTSSGSPTSRSIRPGRARCTAPWCSMPGLVA